MKMSSVYVFMSRSLTFDRCALMDLIVSKSPYPSRYILLLFLLFSCSRIIIQLLNFHMPSSTLYFVLNKDFCWWFRCRFTNAYRPSIDSFNQNYFNFLLFFLLFIPGYNCVSLFLYVRIHHVLVWPINRSLMFVRISYNRVNCSLRNTDQSLCNGDMRYGFLQSHFQGFLI